MANRLNARLREMREARDGQAHRTSDGRSLVLVKNAVVEEQFAALGMRLKKGGSGKRYHVDDRAAAAGRAAADAHNFSAGVGSRSAARIGAR